MAAKPIIGEPALRPTAHPVDLFVAPSRTGPDYQTIADLSSLSPTLSHVQSMVEAKDNEELSQQGRQTAQALFEESAAERDQNREEWNKKVRQFSEIEGQNPYLIEHLQKLAARDTVGRYAADLEASIEKAAALRGADGTTQAPPNLAGYAAQVWDKYKGEYVLSSKFGSDEAYQMKGKVDANFADAVARQRSRNNANENARLTGNELANEYIQMGRSGSMLPGELLGHLTRVGQIQEDARANGMVDIYNTNLMAIRTARRVVAQENPTRALEMGILLRSAIADPVTKKTIEETPAALAELDAEDDHIRYVQHQKMALIREDRALARDDVIQRFRNQTWTDFHDRALAGEPTDSFRPEVDKFVSSLKPEQQAEFKDDILEYASHEFAGFEAERERPQRALNSNEKVLFDGLENEIRSGQSDRAISFIEAVPNEELDQAKKDWLTALAVRVNTGNETLSRTTFAKDAKDVSEPMESIPLGRDTDSIVLRAEARSAVNGIETDFQKEALKQSMPRQLENGQTVVPDALSVQNWIEKNKRAYIERSHQAIQQVLMRYSQARAVDMPNDLDRGLDRKIFFGIMDSMGGKDSIKWRMYVMNSPDLFEEVSTKAQYVRDFWTEQSPALGADHPLPTVLQTRQRALTTKIIKDVIGGAIPGGTSVGQPQEVTEAEPSAAQKFADEMAKASADARAEEIAKPAKQLATAQSVYEVPSTIDARNTENFTRSRVATWMLEQSKNTPGDGGKALQAIARGITGGTRMWPWAMATPDNPDEVFATAQRGARSILDAGPDSPQRFASAQKVLATGGGLTPEMVEAGTGKVEILGEYRRNIDAIVDSLKWRQHVYGLTSVNANEELPGYQAQLVPRTFPFVAKFDPWMTDFGFKSEAQLREWQKSGRLEKFLGLPTIDLPPDQAEEFIRFQVRAIKRSGRR